MRAAAAKTAAGVRSAMPASKKVGSRGAKVAKKRAAAPARRRRPARGGAAPARKEGYRAVILGVVAVALVAGFHVWTGIRVAQLGYQRSKAIELQRRLETQREILSDRLASLLAAEHLEAESERRLGLGPPTAGQVVDLRSRQLATLSRRSIR